MCTTNLPAVIELQGVEARVSLGSTTHVYSNVSLMRGIMCLVTEH